MLRFDPKNLKVPQVHQLLLGGVAPRPIGLVSTISTDGIPNLAPFSFFNAFSANPPIVVFSPARRGRDATLKDTFNNLMEHGECVIQAVTYSMVEQVNVASAEFPPSADEFIKSGLTPVPSEIVKPYRVKESPFQMECILKQMIPLGDGGASGNLAICEVLLFHIDESIMVDGVIIPEKLDAVARMGGDFYTRASGASIFSVGKPLNRPTIGFDGIPDAVRKSQVLSGNDLGKLANVPALPEGEIITEFLNRLKAIKELSVVVSYEEFCNKEKEYNYTEMTFIAHALSVVEETKHNLLHRSAKCALQSDRTSDAWCILLTEYEGEI